ncbi:MAG: hypothetical protein ABI574_17895 [Burkholderiales bacterium]
MPAPSKPPFGRLPVCVFMLAWGAVSAGCSPDTAPPPAMAPASPSATAAARDYLLAAILPDVMDLLVDPAAAVLFAAADPPARVDAEPRSAEAWQAVGDAAAQLSRTSDTLAQPALAQGRADWLQWTASLREGAATAGAAARRHDPRSLFAAGVQVRTSCQACHAQYAPQRAEPLVPLVPLVPTTPPPSREAAKAPGLGS